MDVEELFDDFVQYVDSMDTNALRDNIRKAKEHSSEEIEISYADTNVCECNFPGRHHLPGSLFALPWLLHELYKSSAIHFYICINSVFRHSIRKINFIIILK